MAEDVLVIESRPASAAGGLAPYCTVDLTAPRLSSEQARDLSAVFKALAHPTRVQLMNLLVSSPFAACVCDIRQAMGIPQSTVSHHLKLLVGAGLLRRQQRGSWAYYSVDREAMRQLGAVITLDDAPQQPRRDPAAVGGPR